MLRIRTVTLAASLGLIAGGCSLQPTPLDSAAEAQRVKKEIGQLFAAQAPIDRPISLHEAMARAIKYNLDHRVKLMEGALAKGQLDLARIELLPQLTVEAGYSERNNEAGSSSRSLGENAPNPGFSTSQEVRHRSINSALVWNLLDFGVSYAQAQQQGDRTLINAEKRRKVVQNIIHDVRYAYWRAASAQALLPWMTRIMGRLDDALERVDSLEEMKILPPLTYLNYRRELLETRLQMWQLHEELESARSELSALINVKPGVSYELQASAEAEWSIPRLDIPMQALEEYALTYRPEIREENYQRHIGTLEVKKAMLRMLPGLEISFNTSYDSNQFLYNNTWNEFGVRVNWNLFNLFTGPRRIAAAEAQLKVDKARSLALGMAVITQVHLARLRYETALRDYEISSQLAAVEEGIFDHIQASQKAEIQDELQLIRAEADNLLARMNHHLSYAELQNAFGRLHNSVGVDPLPGELPNHEIPTIAAAIGGNLQRWESTARSLSGSLATPGLSK